ncbi:hypothetical protein ANN_08380 [Periplaneta americana]|uniref:Uncharacterized protein n=1 Tax=Periplaneta americana TaxID=6978 RepID=A0ABQ8T2E4_PERAM|nr:hypothetical protein ANN_08380 [Periplaneta americana]
MAGLCEGGNEPPGFLKAINENYNSVGFELMSLLTSAPEHMDFGPMFIDIYDVVQRAATRGNPRVGTQSETILFGVGVSHGWGKPRKKSPKGDPTQAGTQQQQSKEALELGF